MVRWRSDEHGYGLVTRVLHWATVVLVVAQFALGWALTRADDLLEPIADARFGGEEEALVVVHVGIGITILLLAVLRLGWRLATSLPPWAEGLSSRERRVSHVVEVVLYTCLFLVPVTGLGLFLLSGEDWSLGAGREFVGPLAVLDDDVWLAAHVATQVVFLATLAVHVGMALYHQFVRRDGLVSRML